MTKYKLLINRQWEGHEYIELHVSKSDIDSTQKRIEKLDAVRKVNISKDHLIVYPNVRYDIEEVKSIVESTLKDVVSETAIEDTEGVQDLLGNYLNCQLLYNSAIEKLRNGKDYRNALDDMRLALEKLLKEVLDVNTGLEKMEIPLSKYLKSKETSTEIRNSVVQSLKYLYHYQNNHVKHDNNVNEDDVEYVINQTNVIVRHIINLENKSKK